MVIWKTDVWDVCPGTFCFPHHHITSLDARHIISLHLLTFFLPLPIRPKQVLLLVRMVTVVCFMIDLTDTVLLPLVVDAEGPIT